MIRVTTKIFFLRVLFYMFIVFYIVAKSKILEKPNGLLFLLFIFGVIVFINALVTLFEYLRNEKIVFDIANQPLLDAREAVSGLTFSGEGFVKADEYVNSFYSNLPCVYYRTDVTEIIGSGKHRTYKTLDKKTETAKFVFFDKTDSLRVDLTNMDTDQPYLDKKNLRTIYAIGKKNKKIKSTDTINSEMDCEKMAYEKKMSAEEKEKFGYKTKNPVVVSEFILRTNVPVYVYGYIDKRDNEKFICEYKDNPLIINRKTQKEFVAEFYKGKSFLSLAYLFMYVGCLFLLPILTIVGLISTAVTAVIAWVLFCTFLFLWLFSLYNRIIVLKNRALNAYSNIEGELKRRYDLIPQFDAITKQYSAYEQATMEQIVQIRELVADKDATINGLKILAEKYPELGASTVFKKLSDGLVDTEERVAYSRSFYNSAVENYNTSIQTFPAVVVSVLTQQQPLGFFHLKQ